MFFSNIASSCGTGLRKCHIGIFDIFGIEIHCFVSTSWVGWLSNGPNINCKYTRLTVKCVCGNLTWNSQTSTFIRSLRVDIRDTSVAANIGESHMVHGEDFATPSMPQWVAIFEKLKLVNMWLVSGTGESDVVSICWCLVVGGQGRGGRFGRLRR